TGRAAGLRGGFLPLLLFPRLVVIVRGGLLAGVFVIIVACVAARAANRAGLGGEYVAALRALDLRTFLRRNRKTKFRPAFRTTQINSNGGMDSPAGVRI